MVLKVVRGKILETLELAWFPAVRGSVLAPYGWCVCRTQRVSGPGGASAVSLSKIDDYLADKFCALMLSEVVAGFKNKVDGSRSRFPIWESQRISAP